MSRKPRTVHRIDFRCLPPLDTVLMHEGQRFVVSGSKLHARRDGVEIPLICWRSHCATCGAAFECWTGLKTGSLNRRCSEHHRPGKAVTSTGRRRQSHYLTRHGRRTKSA